MSTDPRSADTLAKALHRIADEIDRHIAVSPNELRRIADAMQARDAALVQQGRDEVAAAVEAVLRRTEGSGPSVVRGMVRAAVAAAGASDHAEPGEQG